MVQQTQREFFQILDDFFRRATGKSAEDFALPSLFGETIRGNAEEIARRGQHAFPWVREQLAAFYGRDKMRTFSDAKACGGLKLALGGNSRFGQSQFNAVRKVLLYADTVLIPDPVLPWLEVNRSEEQFRDVNLIEAVFQLLYLKPLVDADLQSPAIVVFGSFEKTLEAQDPVTQRGILDLEVQTLSFGLGQNFENSQEIAGYVRERGEEFLKKVDAKALFLAPGSQGVPGKLKEEIEAYKNAMRTWRSEESIKRWEGMSEAELVLEGIYERIAPQWHLMENAEELHAHPLLCLNTHWRYFQLCSGAFEDRLLKADLLQPQTISVIRALQQPTLQWLGNVPVRALAELKRQGENERLRTTLSEFISALHESRLEDLDRVASEVGRGIQSLLTEHDKEVRSIEEKYKSLYASTATTAWTTVGALLLPALVPLIAPLIPPVTAAAALGVAGKYAKDKLAEMRERKQISKSLTGVLASAHAMR